MDSEYRLDDLIDRRVFDRNWPNCEEGADGMWHTTFNFELVSPPSEETDWDKLGEEFTATLSGIAQKVVDELAPEAKSFQPEVFATRVVADGVRLTVHVTTLSHIVGAEYVRATKVFFQQMEQRLGPFKTVQNQSPEMWFPL